MRVGRIRPGSYLINTGRPELIDEGSVLDALRGQRLRGAAFDLPSEENLFTVLVLTQENVLVSCHAGSNTEESVRRQAVMAAENVVAVLSGEPKLAALATASYPACRATSLSAPASSSSPSTATIKSPTFISPK